MKKFFLTLFILLFLGGIAFFFGWAQLAVPPGAYGVIRSKTHGIDPRVIREGEFRWVWYKLIPTNAKITIYRLDRKDHPFIYRSTLQSGAALAAFAGIPADFSYEIKGSLSFSIRPDALITLISEKETGTQEDLTAFEEALAGEIEAFVLRSVSSGAEDTGNFEKLLSAGSSEDLIRDIERRFPAVENVSCRIDAAKSPDFALYRSVRGLYEDFLARQKEYLSAELNEKAGNRIETQLHFDELERYGELLTKYPILVQYLALENGLITAQDLIQRGEKTGER
ncbi:MAG: hypothetical protein LBN21_01725 [Treponema sp.]|jgi:hypothetical protein|nr:hypothetical protein [Treponema sp.]